VLASVISQIKAINARPIPQSLPQKPRETFSHSPLPRPTALSNSRRRVYHSCLSKKQATCTRTKKFPTNPKTFFAIKLHSLQSSFTLCN
jgi:hypothetical protein